MASVRVSSMRAICDSEVAPVCPGHERPGSLPAGGGPLWAQAQGHLGVRVGGCIGALDLPHQPVVGIVVDSKQSQIFVAEGDDVAAGVGQITPRAVAGTAASPSRRQKTTVRDGHSGQVQSLPGPVAIPRPGRRFQGLVNYWPQGWIPARPSRGPPQRRPAHAPAGLRASGAGGSEGPEPGHKRPINRAERWLAGRRRRSADQRSGRAFPRACRWSGERGNHGGNRA